MDELIKQRLTKLEQQYSKLCLQLGNIKANQAKLERQENALLSAIEALDKEAGQLKQEAEQAKTAATAKV